MPKYIKIQTDNSVSNATPPQGAISLFYTQQSNQVVPKAKLSNGKIVSLSSSGVIQPQNLITITDSTPLDRKAASKFKLKVTGQYTPSFVNWAEGSEGYLVLYAGSKVTIDPLLVWDGLNKGQTQFAVVKVLCIEGNILASVIYEAGIVQIITEQQLRELNLSIESVDTKLQNIDQVTKSDTDLYTLQDEVQTIQTDINSLPGYSVEGVQEQLTNMNNNVNTL